MTKLGKAEPHDEIALMLAKVGGELFARRAREGKKGKVQVRADHIPEFNLWEVRAWAGRDYYYAPWTSGSPYPILIAVEKKAPHRSRRGKRS